MDIEGYTFIYIIYKCWLMSLFHQNVMLFNQMHIKKPQNQGGQTTLRSSRRSFCILLYCGIVVFFVLILLHVMKIYRCAMLLLFIIIKSNGILMLQPNITFKQGNGINKSINYLNIKHRVMLQWLMQMISLHKNTKETKHI